MSATLFEQSLLRSLGLSLAQDAAGGAHKHIAPVTATPIVWRRCAWCQQVLGVIAVETPTPGLFTDTCCPDCRTKFFAGAAARGDARPTNDAQGTARPTFLPVVTPAGRALIGAGSHEPALPSRTGQRG